MNHDVTITSFWVNFTVGRYLEFNLTKATTKIKTTTTTAEPCIGIWSSWTDYDSCSDRGPGPFKKRRERCLFCSAACKRDGYGAEHEYEFQDCDFKGPNGFWGTGKLKIKINKT